MAASSTLRSISFKRSPRIRAASAVNLGAIFAQGVDTLQEQVWFLRDQEALDNMPNDPEGFIQYSTDRAKALGSDPDAAIWKELVAKAKIKIDERAWQQGIRDGSRTLEGFRDYLVERFNSSKPGTPEAHQALLSLDAAKKAITAKSEAGNDQQALFKYMQSNDFETYQKYLTAKLQRTSDPRVKTVLMGQIKQLGDRALQSRQVERAQSKQQIITDYMSGKMSYSTAIAKLQTLAAQPGITPGEVNAITSEITQIINREKSGGAAAKNADMSSRLQNQEKDYNEAKRAVDQAIANHVQPTNEEWQRLQAATQLLQGTYGDVASESASKGDDSGVKAWTDRATALGKTNDDLAYQRDKVDAGNVTLTEATFLKGIAHLDPQEKVKMIAQRVASLNALAEKARTGKGRDDITTTIEGLKAAVEDIANNIETSDVKPGQTQLDARNHEYGTYLRRWQSESATTDKPLSPETDWERELRYSNDAGAFSAVAGIAYTPEEFQRVKGLIVPADTRSTDAQNLRKDFATLTDMTPTVLDMSRMGGQIGDQSERTDMKGQMAPDATGGGGPGMKSLADPAQADAQPQGGPPAPAADALTPEDQAAMTQAPRTIDNAPVEAPVAIPPQEVPAEDKTLNDYLDGAMKFLDEPTPIDIPEFQIPELPAPEPFSTVDTTSVDSSSGNRRIGGEQLQ